MNDIVVGRVSAATTKFRDRFVASEKLRNTGLDQSRSL
jgi:hypothetical protein